MGKLSSVAIILFLVLNLTTLFSSTLANNLESKCDCTTPEHPPKNPPKHPPKHKPPPKSPHPKPPPVVVPTPKPPTVKPPPVIVTPPKPPTIKPPPVIVTPPPTPCPPPSPVPAPPKGGCPIDVLKLAGCVDVLGGLVHIGLGGASPKEACCPVLQGVADLDAALCLCTTIRAKLLNINIFIPIALQVLVDCGKHPPSDFQCPA